MSSVSFAVIRVTLVFSVVLLLWLSRVEAETRVAYPGVILSNRSTHNNEISLEEAARAHRFAFLRAERLMRGAVHVSDDREIKAPRLESGRPYLCRTAKVRRVIKAARGHINCTANFELQSSISPNDTSYSSLYQHSLMQSAEAWDTTAGSESVIVMVIDTGIDFTHSDLAANMWRNPRETPGNRIDDDKNGYIDDVHGINAIRSSGNPMDDSGHGTHVAGIIGAVGNNARGVVGVNWQVKLAAAKFLSSSGSGTTADAIKSISYTTALKRDGHNVVAINSSWGGSSYSKPMLDAIADAASEGILFVTAAGNSGTNNDSRPVYPASYAAANVISVASVGANGFLSGFSNFGARSVHIAAPGNQIYSTGLSNGFTFKSGTSMAAPQVAGLAALVKSACGTLGMSGIRDRILNSGAKSSALAGLTTTGAMVNAAQSVRSAVVNCSSSSITPPPTATIDPRPTPTPIPTAVPTTAHSFSARPAQVEARRPVIFSADAGSESVTFGTIELSLYDQAGRRYDCSSRGTILLSKGTRTVSVTIPEAARNFQSLAFRFTSRRGMSLAFVSIGNSQQTLVPNTRAEQACQGLLRQFL